MNWLHTAEGDRPDLPARERVEGHVEVQCPACGQWRPGYVVEPLSPADAALRGVDWACDGDRSHWARTSWPPADEVE